MDPDTDPDCLQTLSESKFSVSFCVNLQSILHRGNKQLTLDKSLHKRSAAASQQSLERSDTQRLVKRSDMPCEIRLESFI